MRDDYAQEMKLLLKDEFFSYEEEMKKPAVRGYRVNLLKTSPDELFRILPFSHRQTEFASNAYYLENQPGAGASPAHAAGLFYVQEPSAASAVTALKPRPGMKILDLCAAPGSKTTEIAERMHHEGLLIANEIVPSRARILLANVQRWGAANVIVTNNDPAEIARSFPCFFDAVLVDAPCSGEGMFRKNPDAEKQWSKDLVIACADRQKKILEDAYQCLNPGGVLIYSTCTFSLAENEENMQWFLQQHPDMCLEEIPLKNVHHGIGPGMEKAVRIYPMDGGEGHFVCRLRKKGNALQNDSDLLKSQKIPSGASAFLEENFSGTFPYLYFHNNKLYGGTYPFINTQKSHVLSQDVFLGEMKKDRFEPSHALYMNAYLSAKHTVAVSDEEASAFLKGLTLMHPVKKGYYALQWNGYTIGYAKSDSRMLKNHYPKDLRNR